jgi:hypothetical protein
MVSAELLASNIEQFRLNVATQQVMPVYWINTPDYANGFKGAKGSPEELQAEIDRIIEHCQSVPEEINVNDTESARNFLYRNQVGIDCSAFVYHLIDKTLKSERDESFRKYLYVPKEGVITASTKDSWRVEHELTPTEIAELPPQVPLEWVCKTFNKEPASQVNVARLCNDEASSEVAELEEAQPGDLVSMKKNGKPKHVGVIVKTDGKEWEVWDSYREDAGYGGIMPHIVKIIGDDVVHWSKFDANRYEGFIIRRPIAFQK